MTTFMFLCVIVVLALVGWFLRPRATARPWWIEECDKLGAGRRRQAELANEERLRTQREAAFATLRERGWLAPEIERLPQP